MSSGFSKRNNDGSNAYLKLEHGIPSHETFGRVFCRLDTAAFLEAFQTWIDSFAGCLRLQGIAIDGKTLRGSFYNSCDQSPLDVPTAFVPSILVLDRFCL